MKNSNKGISMISLIVTIIVTILLATMAISTGTRYLRDSKIREKENFIQVLSSAVSKRHEDANINSLAYPYLGYYIDSKVVFETNFAPKVKGKELSYDTGIWYIVDNSIATNLGVREVGDYIGSLDNAATDEKVKVALVDYKTGEVYLINVATHELNSLNVRKDDFVTGHEHRYLDEEPTCTTPVKCADCGFILKEELGHLYEDGVAAESYDDKSHYTKNCKRCDMPGGFALHNLNTTHEIRDGVWYHSVACTECDYNKGNEPCLVEYYLPETAEEKAEKHVKYCSVCTHLEMEGHHVGYRRVSETFHEVYCTISDCDFVMAKELHEDDDNNKICDKCGGEVVDYSYPILIKVEMQKLDATTEEEKYFAKYRDTIELVISADKEIQNLDITIAGVEVPQSEMISTDKKNWTVPFVIHSEYSIPNGEIAFSINCESASGVELGTTCVATTNGKSVVFDGSPPILKYIEKIYRLGAGDYVGGEESHRFEEKSNIYLKSPATCVSAATYYYACTICGISSEGFTNAVYRDGNKNANNHVGGEYTEINPPATVEHDGKKLTKCRSCEAILIEEIIPKIRVAKQAIYTSENATLTFDYLEVLEPGDLYNGYTVVAVYEDFEDNPMTPEWSIKYGRYIKKIEIKTELKPKYTCFWFADFTTAEEIKGLEKIDMSQNTNMSYMFSKFGISSEKDKIEIKGISEWDVSNVVSMSYVFNRIGYSGKDKLYIDDISNWNVSNVQNMSGLFIYSGLKSKVDISSWQTTSLKDMFEMFGYLTVANNAEFPIVGIENLNTSNVTNMNRVFESCYTLKKLDLSGWDTSLVKYTDFMFSGCSSLEELNLANWKTSNISNMYKMFQNCTSLKKLNLSGWNTGSVTNMSCLFYNCYALKEINWPNWDTSSVTSMSYLFYNCYALKELDLSNWDTSSVTSATSMFYGMRYLEKVTLGEKFAFVGSAGYLPMPSKAYISGADGYWYDEQTGISYVSSKIPNNTSATYLAVSVPENLAIYSEDDYSLTFEYASYSAVKNGSYEKNVKEVYRNFENQELNQEPPWSKIKSKIKLIEVKSEKLKPTSTASWFADINNATSITGLEKIDMSENKNMAYMFWGTFYNVESYEFSDIKGWNVSNVEDMSSMFGSFACNATSDVKLDLSGWNTENVTNMYEMFCDFGGDVIGNVEVDVTGWDVSNVENMSYTFAYMGFSVDYYVGIEGLSSWMPSNVTDMSYMFECMGYYASSIKIGDLGEWDVSKVENMADMFAMAGWCTDSWDIGDIGNWNVSNVTDMTYMFAWIAGKAEEINMDLSGWRPASLETMEAMFYQEFRSKFFCDLGEIGNWGAMPNLQNVSDAFYACGIQKLDLSGWETPSLTNTSWMFNACKGLEELDLTGLDMTNVTNYRGMFSGCNKLRKVTLGDNFKFLGTTSSNNFLLNPSSTYIEGADGYWYDFDTYDSADPVRYLAKEIPSNKAATYLAIPPSVMSAMSTSYHEHVFTEVCVTSTYIASVATCESPATYYYKCEMCTAASDTEIFEYGAVDSTKHVGPISYNEIIAPTEETQGVRHEVCDACGAILSKEMVPGE